MARLRKEEFSAGMAILGLVIQRSNTITSKSALRRELEQVLDADLVINNEELAAGLHAIGAPVRSEAGEVVAALSMVAPVSVISPADLADALGPHLVSTADRISARLGHRREDEL